MLRLITKLLGELKNMKWVCISSDAKERTFCKFSSDLHSGPVQSELWYQRCYGLASCSKQLTLDLQMSQDLSETEQFRKKLWACEHLTKTICSTWKDHKPLHLRAYIQDKIHLRHKEIIKCRKQQLDSLHISLRIELRGLSWTMHQDGYWATELMSAQLSKLTLLHY